VGEFDKPVWLFGIKKDWKKPKRKSMQPKTSDYFFSFAAIQSLIMPHTKKMG
jgi:hypothetical protein